MNRRHLLLITQDGVAFSAVLTLGDNGQVGIDTYNYLKNYIDNYEGEPDYGEQYPMPELADIQIKDYRASVNIVYNGKFEDVVIYNYDMYGDYILFIVPAASSSWVRLDNKGYLENYY